MISLLDKIAVAASKLLHDDAVIIPDDCKDFLKHIIDQCYILEQRKDKDLKEWGNKVFSLGEKIYSSIRIITDAHCNNLSNPVVVEYIGSIDYLDSYIAKDDILSSIRDDITKRSREIGISYYKSKHPTTRYTGKR